MDITVDHVSDLKKVCRLFINKEAFSQKINAKFSDFQKNARIKGFRAGKVKVDYIKKRYGKAIEQELVSELMENAWKDILENNNFKPVTQPEADVEGMKDDGFHAQITFEIAPTIETRDPETFDLELIEAKVEKNHVEKIIDDLMHQYGDTTDKESASLVGDVVIADIERHTDGESEPQEMKDQSILLQDDKTLPIIVKELTGVVPGDQKEFSHTYEDDWHDKSLAGKKVSFKTTITKVQTLEKCSLEKVKEQVIGEAELNESEIFDKFSELAKNQADQRVFEKNKDTLLNYLVESHDIELPESLKEQAQQGNDENTNDRLKSLKIGFIVDSYVSKLGIKVDQAAMEKQLQKMATQFGMPAQQLFPLISKNKEIQQNLHHEATLDTLAETLLKKVSTEKKVLAYDEVMK